VTGQQTRRICVVTGSRADYGLLTYPMRAIANHPQLQLQVAATGMHLAPDLGDTQRQIEADGFTIDARVESLLSGDSAVAVTKSIGLGTIGFADAFDRLQPDIVVLLGDRYEVLAAAQAALIAGVPVAHLCGGDTTEGAFDEMIRHAITKMAHLHLVTNDQAALRVRQMGEDPAHIHNVGSPGLDAIRHADMLPWAEFWASLPMSPRHRNLLVSIHPATLGGAGRDDAGALLDALATFDDSMGFLITGSNADTAGRALNTRLKEFAAARPNACFVQSLGSRRYISAMRHCDALVGNSSSGLYEAPSLGIRTIDIGDRQKGRLRGDSVIWSPGEPTSIRRAIESALALGRGAFQNPYGDGYASDRIVRVLCEAPSSTDLLRKPFFDL